MRKKYISVAFLLMVGFFFADMAVDAVSSHEEAATTATACHECVCGNHFLPEVPAPLVTSTHIREYLVFEPAIQEFVSVTDIFHPPTYLI